MNFANLVKPKYISTITKDSINLDFFCHVKKKKKQSQEENVHDEKGAMCFLREEPKPKL